MVTLPQEEFEAILARAAERGARHALSEVGLANGSMRPENAAALVGAGVLSVAVFPLAATWLERRATPVTG